MTFELINNRLVVELSESNFMNLETHGELSIVRDRLVTATQHMRIYVLYLPGHLISMGKFYFESSAEYRLIRDFVDSSTIFKPYMSL